VRPSGLDDLIQQGARQIIQQAIEAELAALLERYDNVKTLDGRRTVIRNGYLPEREVVTAIGPVTVKVPKVRDRSGSGVKFNSNIVPPYIRKSPRVSAALPWLYLRGVSTGDMGEALSVLLGEEAKGLSPNVVSRLKAQCGKWLLHLAKTDVLVLDDWGMGAIDSTTRSDLLEVIDDRAANKATIITSQLPVEHWHAWIGDATIADAILDRIMQRHYRFTLTGDSLRTERPTTSKKEQTIDPS